MNNKSRYQTNVIDTLSSQTGVLDSIPDEDRRTGEGCVFSLYFLYSGIFFIFLKLFLT